MHDAEANLIGGSRRPAAGDETLVICDPATGDPLARIPAGHADDAAAAVEAAGKAQASWRRTPAGERAGLLKEGARRLRRHADELADLQTAEMGKPIADSRGGVEAGIATVEQYAELGPLHRGRSLNGAWGATDLMVHEPHGVAACVVPWNDPVAVALGLVSACLVTGSTVVLKPSERAPLAVLRAAELLELPPGVLNVVLGDGRAGGPLVEHAGVDLVCFVGSVTTGRGIAERCARRLTKAVLELGGKDALIVDRDVDPRWAADQAATGAFANAGQICTAVERIYVHQEVAGDFVDALVGRASSLVMGPGRDPETELGPLVDRRQRDTVHQHVRQAVDAGARLRAGGTIPDGPGSFYPATVLTGCRADMAVMAEETFGPVAAVEVVPSFDAGVEAANACQLGLAAAVLTGSQEHAQRAWRDLDVGTVKINAVFGGAPGGAAEPAKASGLGYGYGPELLDEVTRTKVVHQQPPP